MKKLLTLWVLLVSFALCVNAQTYISAVKVGGGSKDAKTSKSRATNGGYTLIDRDLNEKASGSYVYLSYKTTTNPTLAISDIIIFKGKQWQSDWYLSNGVTVNGKKYYLAPYENKDADWGDLNDGAGGSYLYVFYTRDFSPTRITSLAITSNAGLSVKQYDGSNIYNSINLNEGAGGTTMYLQVNRSGCTHERMLYSECPDCGYKLPAFYETHTFDPNDNSRCTHCDHVFVQYTASERVMPNVKQPFGDATIITNTFADGKGYYELDNAPTKIADGAFTDIGALTSISLLEGITSIGEKAFYMSGLSGKLNLPNTLETIYNEAFRLCENLSGELILPNSLVSIGRYAFTGCHSLTGSLHIPNSVTFIGESAFSSLRFNGQLTLSGNLESIEKNTFFGTGFTGAFTIPDKVKTIGENAFGACGFTSVKIGGSVKSIGKMAFSDCWNLASCTISKSVTTIGAEAFARCNALKTVICEGEEPASLGESSLFWLNKVVYVPLKAVKRYREVWSDFTVEAMACDHVLPQETPNTCSLCGASFVYYTSTDNTIVVPNVKKKIQFGDAYLVKNYYDYKEHRGVYMLDKVPTEISEEAFCYCTNLKSFEIPNTVTSIGYRAFGCCDGLTGNLVIPNSVTSIGGEAFTACGGLTGNLVIPNTVTSIGSRAFNACSGFTGKLVIPNSVTYIEYGTFSGCSGFTGELTIPEGVTGIGAYAFSNCKFTNVTFPSSLVNIGESAFTRCRELSGNLIIPNSVTTIGSCAFGQCGINGKIVIPSSVTSIDKYAFTEILNAKFVVCEAETPPTINTGYGILYGTTYPIYVPGKSLDTYKNDAGWSLYKNRLKSMDELPVYELGDVDYNNKMGVGDIAALISILNGKSGDVYDTADMNGDGKIDVKDLEVLKDVLLNGVPLVQGKFSVSATKQVQFTSGNLYWDGGQYRIEKNQTDFPTTKTASHVGNFYWTSLADYQSGKAEYMPYAENYAFSTQSYDDKFFCGEENPLTVDGLKGLYAMSNDEWKYLLNSRANADKLYKVGVLVNGKKNCLVIAPDDFKGTLKSSYTLDELNAQGLVCLPAAGSYYGSGNFSYNYNGYYWTMSAFGIMKDCGEIMKTTSDEAGTAGYSRYCGCSIRLVRTAE